MRARLKAALNAMLAPMDLRIVARDWGPRGFRTAFQLARRSGINPDLVFDIGAAEGTWTRDVITIFPAARYVLIDPLPQNSAALKEAAKKAPNIHYVNAAIGAESGSLDLYTHGDQSSFLRSADFSGRAIRVAVRTCDDVLADVPNLPAEPSILVKIDVQGHEVEVLKGAHRTLDHTEILLVEVSTQRIYENSPLAHEVVSYLGERGFCIFDVASYVQRPLDRKLCQMDLVFVRTNSALMSRVGWK